MPLPCPGRLEALAGGRRCLCHGKLMYVPCQKRCPEMEKDHAETLCRLGHIFVHEQDGFAPWAQGSGPLRAAWAELRHIARRHADDFDFSRRLLFALRQGTVHVDVQVRAACGQQLPSQVVVLQLLDLPVDIVEEEMPCAEGLVGLRERCPPNSWSCHRKV